MNKVDYISETIKQEILTLSDKMKYLNEEIKKIKYERKKR